MADPTLYLFDGWNLLHAGGFRDPRELVDRLASFVGTSGARGILVFDGSGPDERIGPLEIRFAEHADALLERLAAEHRRREEVCIVSSDSVIRGVSGSGGADGLVAALPGRRGRRRARATSAHSAWATASTKRRARSSSVFAAVDSSSRFLIVSETFRTLRTFVRITMGPLQFACNLVQPLLSSASSSG